MRPTFDGHPLDETTPLMHHDEFPNFAGHFSAPGDKTPLKEHDEYTPLKKLKAEDKHRKSFVTGRWLLALLVASTGLAILGSLAHRWHERRLESHKTAVAAMVKEVPKASTTRPPQVDNTVEFLKCNPSLISPLAVSFLTNGAMAKDRAGKTGAFTGDGCGAKQTALVMGLLRKYKYDFKATVPKPYMYPTTVLEVLLGLDRPTLNAALGTFKLLAKENGKLGSLVTIFAWGMPIHEKDLWTNLGGEQTVEALQQCNIIRQCDGVPYYTSNIQLSPLQHSKLIVATDWQLPPSKIPSRSAPLVETLSEYLAVLAHNIPVSTGLSVLDLASTGGTLGLVAATRGAKIVQMLQPQPRGYKLAKFNVMLNGLTKKVNVTLGALEKAGNIYGGGASAARFYLILSHPSGPSSVKEMMIRSALTLSHSLLLNAGSLVMGVEGRSCEEFSTDYMGYICADPSVPDLTGSMVCRSHTKEGPAEGPSSEGIFYIWKEKHQDNDGICGHFKYEHIKRWDSDEAGEACGFARVGMTCRM